MSDPRNEPPRYGERVPGASVPPPPDALAAGVPSNGTPFAGAQYPDPPEQLTAPPRPTLGSRMSGAWVSYLLIGLCIVVFLLQSLTGLQSGPVTQASVFFGPYAISEPWRFLTSLFVHGNLLHIASNMFSLFVLGPQLERLIGHWRFAVLYFLSGFAGGVAVELLLPATPTLGASGAIFGLLGAYFVIARRMGGNVGQIVGVIVINLAIGFYLPSIIAWQAHVGGLIVGAVVALIYGRRRTNQASGASGGLLIGVAVILAVIAIGYRVLVPA